MLCRHTESSAASKSKLLFFRQELGEFLYSFGGGSDNQIDILRGAGFSVICAGKRAGQHIEDANAVESFDASVEKTSVSERITETRQTQLVHR